jgi:flavine halogenase
VERDSLRGGRIDVQACRGKSGAKIFDGVKVNTLDLVPLDGKDASADFKAEVPRQPVSATWSHKDGSSGVIKVEYLVDASG